MGYIEKYISLSAEYQPGYDKIRWYMWYWVGIAFILMAGHIEEMEATGLWINTLRPGQNGRNFADDIFKRIFLNENVWTPIKISLKFIPKGPINNIPALVQIMALRWPGDKPLSEPMMVRLPTHICVTRPQWVNASPWEHNLFEFVLNELPIWMVFHLIDNECSSIRNPLTMEMAYVNVWPKDSGSILFGKQLLSCVYPRHEGLTISPRLIFTWL